MTPKIVKGPQTANDIPMGFGEYFFESAEKYGDRVCQIHYHTNESVTFKEVKRRSVKVALYLQRNGIKPGDVVMFLGKNDIENMVAILAAVFLGALVSSLDMRQGLFDIKHCIDLVKPKFMIVVEERLELIEKALTEIDFDTKIVVIGESSSKYPNMCDAEKETVEEENSFKPLKVDVKKEAAFIMLSSGTTSMPKALLWSHFTSMYGLVKGGSFHTAAALETKPIMQFIGLFYNVGIQLFCASLVNGSTMVTLKSGVSLDTYFEIIERYQINSLLFTSKLLHKLICATEEETRRYNNTPLKLMTLVGSTVGGQYILKLRERFPSVKVVQGYGSSEIGSGCFLWTSEELNSKFYDMKPDSSGKAGDNVEVKVIDVHTGELLGPNQEGEIFVKSPSKMLGYYHRQFPTELYDEDGFYKTGDIGYYDEDEYFYITDRKTDIYKFNAYTISPAIIEILLMTHPAIKEAIVAGVPHPVDEYHGAACVVLNEGLDISLEEIDKLISENLGDTYRLRGGVKFVEEIPRTVSGKLKRRVVREMFVQTDKDALHLYPVVHLHGEITCKFSKPTNMGSPVYFTIHYYYR